MDSRLRGNDERRGDGFHKPSIRINSVLVSIVVSFSLMGAAGCGAKSFVEKLTSDDPVIRRKAFHKLNEMPFKKRARFAPDLAQKLNHENHNVSNRAIDALALIGPQAVEAVKPYLQHEDAFVVSSAVEVLGKMGPKAAKARPDISPLVDHPHPLVQEEALLALALIEKTPQKQP